MFINSRLTNEQLLTAIYEAAEEYEKLLGKDFLIIGKNRNTEYFWFECFFEKKNFMHLLGIKSKTMSANDFFDECIFHNKGEDSKLTLSDCSPSRNHNRTTINEKSSCCAEMLKIQDAKYMNIGGKDKISQFVDFSYAYGSDATLGFKRNFQNKCFPITLIPKSIDNFTTKRYKIIFVFEKEHSDRLYEKLLMEVKKGIIEEHFKHFPKDLGSRIKWNCWD